MDGNQLLMSFREKVRVHSSGISSIDRLMQGGIREDQFTEVLGACGCGKTQVSLACALTGLLEGEHVSIIDGTSGQHVRRLRKMLKAQHPDLIEEEMSALFDRLSIIRVFDAYTLCSALQSVQSIAPNQGPRIVIIDGLGSILHPLTGGSTHHSQGRAALIAVARLIKVIARDQSIAMIGTTHTSSSFLQQKEHEQEQSALGLSWCTQPHCRILLRSTSQYGATAKSASTIASTLQLSSDTALFHIIP